MSIFKSITEFSCHISLQHLGIWRAFMFTSSFSFIMINSLSLAFSPLLDTDFLLCSFHTEHGGNEVLMEPSVFCHQLIDGKHASCKHRDGHDLQSKVRPLHLLCPSWLDRHLQYDYSSCLDQSLPPSFILLLSGCQTSTRNHRLTSCFPESWKLFQKLNRNLF